MALACDRHQASILHNYVKGYFEAIPALSQMIVNIGADFIELSNRVRIEIHATSFRGVRGRSILCTVLDEVAFFRDENFALPDIELDAALSPGLERVQGSMQVLISSVHKRSGLLYQRWRDLTEMSAIDNPAAPPCRAVIMKGLAMLTEKEAISYAKRVSSSEVESSLSKADWLAVLKEYAADTFTDPKLSEAQKFSKALDTPIGRELFWAAKAAPVEGVSSAAARRADFIAKAADLDEDDYIAKAAEMKGEGHARMHI